MTFVPRGRAKTRIAQEWICGTKYAIHYEGCLFRYFNPVPYNVDLALVSGIQQLGIQHILCELDAYRGWEDVVRVVKVSTPNPMQVFRSLLN